ncbi:MAG: YebC/PmpR family DNA-binding transcriptional regulator [Candidatus Marinimicrobia bacterium]|nr:YebC/PmpR family DNA-binding transcriptional regulator [Candidatus Neomarinimicrobiota bacterium]
MSGHSKWANIKYRKAAQDTKRAKIWTKLLKEITIAAREGGGDENANPRLRTALIKARSNNIPNDTIIRAIKKGIGELEGIHYEEITYEGYGPGSVALLIEAVTDNKQRTVSEIRYLLTKHGGSLGEAGSVAWNFTRTGIILIPVENISEDDLLADVLEAGAEDMKRDVNYFEITTDLSSFNDIHEMLAKKYPVENAEISWVPRTTVKIDDLATAEKFVKLYDLLKDHDDIQNIWDNSDIPEEIINQLESN